MNDHLPQGRLLQLLRDFDADFSKQELDHLAICQECREELTRIREFLSAAE